MGFTVVFKRLMFYIFGIVLVVSVVGTVRNMGHSCVRNEGSGALSPFLSFLHHENSDALLRVQREWDSDEDALPKAEDLARHIQGLRTIVTDPSRIRANTALVQGVIDRVRQEFDNSEREFAADPVQLWITRQLRARILFLLEKGIFRMAAEGKIDPLMQVRRYPGEVLEEEPKHGFVCASNSANPPTWGHVAAMLMGMIESGASKIVIYTSWSSGGGIKRDLAPLDLRLSLNDLLVEILGGMAVRATDLAHYDPTGKDKGKVLSGTGPTKVMALNSTVSSATFVAGTEHVDDMAKLSRYAKKHNLDRSRINFVFIPRSPGIRKEFAEVIVRHNLDKLGFAMVMCTFNPTGWLSATKFRRGEGVAISPYSIRKAWLESGQYVGPLIGRMDASRRRPVVISGFSGDVSAPLAANLKRRGIEVRLPVRGQSRSKPQKGYSPFTVAFAEFSSLFDMDALASDVDFCGNYVHSAGMPEAECENVEEQARMLTANGFATGLVAMMIKTRNPSSRLLYISSSGVYGIKDTPQNRAWLNAARDRFKVFVNQNGLLAGHGDIEDLVMKFALDFLNSHPVPVGVNVYALSKLLGEAFSMEVDDYCIGRLTDIYGPGCAGNGLVSRLIETRLSGAGMKLDRTVRDYVYVDDINEAVFHILDESDIGFLRVIDFAGGTKISAAAAVDTLMKLTPSYYGRIDVVDADAESDTNGFPSCAVPAVQPDLRSLFNRPLKTFDKGVEETLTYFRKKKYYREVDFEKHIYDFVFEGEKLVSRLWDDSSVHLFSMRGADGGKFVRKVIVNVGTEEDAMRMDDSVPVLRSGRVGSSFWFDIPHGRPGSADTGEYVDYRDFFMRRLANRLGKVIDIHKQGKRIVVRTPEGDAIELECGGRTAINISRAIDLGGGVVRGANKADAVACFVKNEHVSATNIVMWGDATQQGGADAAVTEDRRISGVTLIGVSRQDGPSSATLELADFPEMNNAALNNADRTQASLSMLKDCYDEAQGDGPERRRNALDAFFDRLGLVRRCNRDSDVALAFDVDYTLICDSKLDSAQKEDFVYDRSRLAELIGWLKGSGFRIAILTDKNETVIDRVAQPIQTIAGRFDGQSIDVFSSGSTTRSLVWPDGTVEQDHEYNAGFRLGQKAKDQILGLLGSVEERNNGEIVCSGLLGQYYDRLSDYTRFTPDSPSFPLATGFAYRNYPGFSFSPLNLSPYGNLLVPVPKVKMANDGVGINQINVLGIVSDQFSDVPSSGRGRANELTRRISSVLFRIACKADGDEALQSSAESVPEIFASELETLSLLASLPELHKMLGDEHRQKTLIQNQTLRLLVAMATKNAAVLKTIEKGIEDDDVLGRLTSYIIAERRRNRPRVEPFDIALQRAA